MRLLPREHGATASWFASVLLAFLVLPGWPPILPGVGFACAALLALVLLGALTGRSAVVMRLERNPMLLPALSSPLTLIVPFGYLVMAGPLTLTIVSVWLVFLVYTATGIVYTGDAVRAVLKETAPGWGLLLASAGVLGVEAAVLAGLGWVSPAAVAVLAPLFVHRLAIPTRGSSSHVPKARRIRIVGVAESANLIAAAVVLAWASRL